MARSCTCGTCPRCKKAEWYQRNKERVLLQQKEYRETNRDALLSREAVRRERKREQRRDRERARYRSMSPEERAPIVARQVARNRVHRYGMVFAPGQTLETLLAAQQGKCAICEENLSSGKHRHVDHCHTTGRVRAVLCRACNIGLGNFREQTAYLERAAAYLRQHSASVSNSDDVLK